MREAVTTAEAQNPAATDGRRDMIRPASLRPTASGSAIACAGIGSGLLDCVVVSGGCMMPIEIPEPRSSRARVRVRLSIAPLVDV